MLLFKDCEPNDGQSLQASYLAFGYLPYDKLYYFDLQDGATLLHLVAGCKGVEEETIDAYVDTARELLQHGFSLVARDKVPKFGIGAYLP